METLEDVLEHYGIKGMRWGVRRSEKQLARERAKKPKVSEDARRADRAQEKAKTKGLKSLSNQELDQLNKRMNLEQNYARLTAAENASKVRKGAKFIKGAKKTQATVASAVAFSKTPPGKAIKKAVTEAVTVDFTGMRLSK